ncbi:TetR/AcrR family transcriptional regulator [Nonomuraea sp. CA-143628]|uniref:TetR/AcrR family transcriptional regulator n=1 Tax=Nonomuraea sp. CA-143628 TaxID=3239997 RepID=UPI003D922F84
MARRGSYAKGRARRAEIADAALALVVERGHDRVSIADVSERARVPESTLMYYFPTRDHLLVAAMASAEQIELGDPVPQEMIDDPAETLRATVARDMEEPQRMRLFLELQSRASDPDHPAHEFIRYHHSLAHSQLAATLRARQAIGLAHPQVDPERFAFRMAAVWDGLQARWLVDRNFDLAEAVADSFRELAGEHILQAQATLDRLVSEL